METLCKSVLNILTEYYNHWFYCVKTTAGCTYIYVYYVLNYNHTILRPNVYKAHDTMYADG